MPYNRPALRKIRKIKQETPTVKSFRFHSDLIAREAKSGQFIMFWVPGIDEFPISIASAYNSEFEIAVSKVGEGTEALHQKKVGDYIGIRGPYGSSFSLDGEKFCAIAGGYASSTIRHLIEKSWGKEFTVLLGAKTTDELLYKHKLEKFATVKVATEDGSEGHRGLVTDLLSKLFKYEKFDQVFTCGPEPMMEKVCEITRKYETPTQVCVERIVKCACGICGSCVVGKHRVCKEGPVFDAEELLKTEFGRWKRDKAGRRVPIEGIPVQDFKSFPLVQFTPQYDPYLETEICGVKLSNPSMNTSGMGVSGEYMYRIVVEGGSAAIVTKSTGLKSREGYNGPNFTDNSVNAMGLPNLGIENYGIEIEDMKNANVPIFISLFGETPEECKKVASIAVGYGIDAIEQNISCGHTSLGSVEKDPELVKEIIKTVVSVAHPKNIPVSVKISANVDYIEVAKAAVEGGVDAITAINTVKVRPMNSKLNIPILASTTGHGGLSGKNIKKRSEQVLEDLYAEVDVPVISVGGIEFGTDYIRRFKKGASACQVGTATIHEGFRIYRNLNQELRNYLVRNDYNNVREIIGINSKK